MVLILLDSYFCLPYYFLGLAFIIINLHPLSTFPLLLDIQFSANVCYVFFLQYYLKLSSYPHETSKNSVLWACRRPRDPLERSRYDSYYPICNEISRETQTNPNFQMCKCNNLVACNKIKCYHWRKARHVKSKKIAYIYITPLTNVNPSFSHVFRIYTLS